MLQAQHSVRTTQKLQRQKVSKQGKNRKRRGLWLGGGVSEEGVAPLLQTQSAEACLAAVRAAGVFEPLCEHLAIFLQQQELTEDDVGLETHQSQAEEKNKLERQNKLANICISCKNTV